MKTYEEIFNKIVELRNDQRLSYEPANVFTNAPLALIQTQLRSELHALEYMLELPYSTMPIKKQVKKKK